MLLAIALFALVPESTTLVCESSDRIELCRHAPIYDGSFLVAEVSGEECDSGAVHWQDRRYLLHSVSETRYHALAPVALNSDVGEHSLQVRCGDRSASFLVQVERAPYPESELRVAKRFSKSPPPRVAKEAEAIREALSRESSSRAWKAPFILPRRDRVTSVFGVRRLFNKTLESQHRGLDLDGRRGQRVDASNAGVVVLVARNFFYVGNAVFIDHGESLYSMYFHLSETFVQVGDRVSRGQWIGLVGRTGRVTGPHLHFGIKMSGHYVDPSDVIAYRADILRGEPTIPERSASPAALGENRSD